MTDTPGSDPPENGDMISTYGQCLRDQIERAPDEQAEAKARVRQLYDTWCDEVEDPHLAALLTQAEVMEATRLGVNRGAVNAEAARESVEATEALLRYQDAEKRQSTPAPPRGQKGGAPGPVDAKVVHEDHSLDWLEGS